MEPPSSIAAVANNNYRGNQSPESASLNGLAAGTYYARVVRHDANLYGIASYDFSISAPSVPNPGVIAFTSTQYSLIESGGAWPSS
ncbi:MAG: hypothetical protein U0794_03135 [Isosphaeraceae bacterium]